MTQLFALISHSPYKVLCLFMLIANSLLINSSAFSQDNIKNLLLYEPDTTVFTIVEKQPEFPGGFSALKDYMKLNVKYPTEARKLGVTGRVFVSFIVESNGQFTDVGILKGLGFGCDEEAMRVVKAMPRWLAGSQSGKPLRVRYHLPVLFGIDYPKSRVRQQN